MSSLPSALEPSASVRNLLEIYGAPRASAAYFLCDRHDPAAVAYTVVAPDLSPTNITYGELREESERLAAGLFALGIRPGDRVATLLGKSRAYLVAVMAIWRLGAVHVPLFTAFATQAIALRLRGSAAKAVICDTAQQKKIMPGDAIPIDAPWRVITTAANPEAASQMIGFWDILEKHPPGFRAAGLGGDAPLIQMYTSGTTGRPKSVVVPLRALASFHAYVAYALDIRDDDVFWNSADPGWGYGLYFGVLATFISGVRSIFLEGGFSVEKSFEVLARFRITNFASSPTVFRSLRASRIIPSKAIKLRCASSAGEPLTPEVNEWSAEALGVLVHDHYGQTETGMVINNHHHHDLRRPLKSGSMGHPMPGWMPAILRHDRDELAPMGEFGRVAINLSHSPLAWFRGYVDDPTKSAEKFSADGRWYITGDIGRCDDEGYFYFSSRDDDVIIMAGYRIGPFEVESVLVTHPAVAECAVVAVRDDLRGEVLEAVVVLREGHSGSQALTEELRDWVKTRYAAHACPRRVHYVSELPKTPSGKLQRFVVREQLRQCPSEGTSCT